MPRKTIAGLEEQLRIVRELNEEYLKDIEKLRNELEEVKKEKNVVTLQEVKFMKREIESLKISLRGEKDRSERWKTRYEAVIKDKTEKNARGAGRKMFSDKDTIQDIYNMYLEGKSLRDIAQELNEGLEINKWTKSGIRFILGNPKNIELEFIDKTTFDRTIQLIEERRRNRKSI